MSKKRKNEPNAPQAPESSTPVVLPRHSEQGGHDLSSLITRDYSLADADFLGECYTQGEKELAQFIGTCDRFTPGSVADSMIDSQIRFLEEKHRNEVAMHELCGANIVRSREIRKEELERRIPGKQARMASLKRQIEPLAGKRAQFSIRIGSHRLSAGAVVTIAAMIFDAFVNYSFLQNVLQQHWFMLLLTVVGLSIMSDGGMFAVGELISRRGEDFVDVRLRRVYIGVLLGAFLASVAASIAIRVGSMDSTFGTLVAIGVYAAPESYSAAQWATALLTALLPATTGVLSLVFSVDRNGYLEKRRLELEAELKRVSSECGILMDELSALNKAPDPMLRDRECRKAAEKNLETLRCGLKIHVRKLLAVRQASAPYTDAMGESADKVLAAAREAAPTITTVNLKEAV